MKVDMSEKAVSTRLIRTSQLRNLCLSLSKAKPLPRDVHSTPEKGSSATPLQASSSREETSRASGDHGGSSSCIGG